MRTSFYEKNNSLYQNIHEKLLLKIKVREDKRDLYSDGHESIDATSYPLIRVILHKKSSHEYFLNILMHHIITDGWSQNLMIKELNHYYNNLEFTYLNTFQYRDFSLWESQQDNKNHMRYWENKLLKFVPYIYLKPDFLTNKKEFISSKILIDLTSREKEKLFAAVYQSQTTLFVWLLTAFKLFLYKQSRIQDLVVASAVSNRIKKECASIMGPLVNIVFLRNYYNPDISFQEFLSQVKKTTIAALSNQNYPYYQIIESLPELKNASRPLYQIMFLHNMETPLNFNDIDVQELISNSESIPYDFVFDLRQKHKDFNISFKFATEKFKYSTIHNWALQFHTLIQELINIPHPSAISVEEKTAL